MTRPRFDAKALALSGLSRDQVRMLESLFKDVDALSVIQVLLAAPTATFPAGRVLTDTSTIDIDTATAGQIKASVIDGSITTAKLGGDITTAGKALLDDATATDQLTTLGVSAFAQTLLDDPDAATARATLGISGGSAAWTEYEIDFGTAGVYDATFTVIDAAVSATTEVAVVQSGVAATDRGAGDALWDSIAYAAVPAAGQFTLYAMATPGPVAGKRKILYQVGT
jgi:hypothetical protein